jgi:hypothetical protein
LGIFSKPSGNVGVAKAKATYIEPAALVDVLFDQLEWLVAHSNSTNCSPECSSCSRLQHVVFWLTRPFEEKTKSK